MSVEAAPRSYSNVFYIWLWPAMMQELGEKKVELHFDTQLQYAC